MLYCKHVQQPLVLWLLFSSSKTSSHTVRKMGYMPMHSNGCPRGAIKLATGTAVDSCCAASTQNCVLQMYVL